MIVDAMNFTNLPPIDVNAFVNGVKTAASKTPKAL